VLLLVLVFVFVGVVVLVGRAGSASSAAVLPSGQSPLSSPEREIEGGESSGVRAKSQKSKTMRKNKKKNRKNKKNKK
jgi:hypothetical protein